MFSQMENFSIHLPMEMFSSLDLLQIQIQKLLQRWHFLRKGSFLFLLSLLQGVPLAQRFTTQV